MKLTPKAPGVPYNGSHIQFVSRNTMRFNPLSKTLVAAAVAGLASVGASTAFAQMAPQSVDMTVTGTIVPASCSANFTGGGEVDFGTIRLIDLPDSAYYRIPGTKDVTLNVNCNAGKRVMFAVTDAQTANAIADTAMYTALGGITANANYVFGLGTATVGSTPVNLGSYAIQMQAPTATVGGTSAVRTAITSTNGTTWGAANWVSKATTGFPAYSAGTSATAVITTGTVFQFPLRVSAALNYGSRLQVADNTTLNGQAIFAISYQ